MVLSVGLLNSLVLASVLASVFGAVLSLRVLNPRGLKVVVCSGGVLCSLLLALVLGALLSLRVLNS